MCGLYELTLGTKQSEGAQLVPLQRPSSEENRRR